MCGVVGSTILVVQSGCVRGTATEPSDSEVATSAVSGALNNTIGSTVAMNMPRAPKRSTFARGVDALNPVGTAWAASWSCSGGSLSPSFAGPGKDPYSFTPLSCMVTWDTGRTASATWSGPFTLNYGSSCDSTHPFIENQAAGCAVTRTIGNGGDTRTLTGPDGNSYAINHDTDGAGTGWDSTVSPAPTSKGVQVTCATAGCDAGKTLVISGSHLTGTVSIGGRDTKIWDHTVSTGGNGVIVTGTGTGRVVTGSVTVQHNILRYTTNATFNSVGYGEAACCFPTSGNVTTTFIDGASGPKTETLSFTAACSEATLTTANGTLEPVTLAHCL
jgi:hypothetical protein